ncbi:MAG: DNA repair protein RadC [Clostridia bacterium]|nr:DNA repair protein RadC [Clostridia bacterium]
MDDMMQSVDHSGHRKRLRERFRQNGLEGFAPHEVLELLLLYARVRGNVNPTAHALLDTFGSLKGVFEATPQQLMAVYGVGEEAATLISLMVPLFRKYNLCLAEERKSISSTAEAREYCRALLAGQRTERFYVICLGANRAVLGRRLIAEGTLGEVAAYPRLIVETALNLNAHGVIVCHNHPDGLAEPSEDDLTATRHLYRILNDLDMQLLDHVIVAGTETYSLAEADQLTAKNRKGI